MPEQESFDRLLEQLTGNAPKAEPTPETPATEEEQLARKLEADRKDKVSGFKLQLDLDDFGELPPSSTRPVTTEPPVPEEPAESRPQPMPLGGAVRTEPEEELKPLPPPSRKKKKKSKGYSVGAALGVILGVLLSSALLSFVFVSAAVDLLGLTTNATLVDVTIPEGANTREVADILKENGVISQKLIFRMYSRMSGGDGTYQPGQFTVSADMGYDNIIAILQTVAERETVTVTFPEGSTLLDIAELLEANNVCSQKDFFNSLKNDDFSADYDFVKAIPDNPNRLYKLEGYLFPDTYDFFVESAPYSAICRFLDNFDNKFTTSMRSAVKAKGMTIDQIVTLASVIQKEDDSNADISKVSRVFWNRLESPANFPKLQSDITQMYVGQYGVSDKNIHDAYDTYVCDGLPVGAICNPGLKALDAAIYPSTSDEVAGCYYFISDMESGETYYSRTKSEHDYWVAILYG
ncbi:MAG: endolytic transglycosylase MltG [Clostridia bacterium]|nr:endolytic transglycosylase MltG [Clostridia bacterium]